MIDTFFAILVLVGFEFKSGEQDCRGDDGQRPHLERVSFPVVAPHIGVIQRNIDPWATRGDSDREPPHE